MTAHSLSPIPCIIYGRKSTEDVRGSIPRQHVDARAAIEREGGRQLYAPPLEDVLSVWKGDEPPGLQRAKRLAERAAREHGAAELWVQHSDRLARGDGIQAAHLVEH